MNINAVSTISLLGILSLAGCAESRTPSSDDVDDREPVVVEDQTDRLVEDYIRSEFPDSGALEYAYGTANLDKQGPEEFLIYISGPQVCGSGGCNVRVAQPGEDGMRTLGRLTVSRLPLGTLTTISQGFRDIGVTVAGGGLEPVVMRIPFDGEAYASNPTVAPAKPVGSLNQVIVPRQELTPLPASSAIGDQPPAE